ncbi:MAG: hypothetical protein IPJ76_04520 [Flavobacteriales bacterium]|nr:MAG: hypothetical protein IPJ76_04520 [Flavobacteriales bacterium]
MKHAFLLLLPVLLIGCGKEAVPTGEAAHIVKGRIVVNELQATASAVLNEFGEEADWFEIHNPGPAITLKAGEWFVSDNTDSELREFELPEITLPEGGLIVIWCDERKGGRDIHASFKLSTDDGSVAIIHAEPKGLKVIDEAPIEASPGPDVSYGRVVDGAAAWGRMSPPTPGAPNDGAPETP